jgi:hypothetical protein
MITEDYCSYEVAKLLKEKGFNEPCRAYWDDQPKLDMHTLFFSVEPIKNSEQIANNTSCPTYQMTMKWLREIHNICITIYPNKERGYEAVLYNIKDDVEILLQSFGIYGSHIFENSYKGAVETALKYSLENLI